MLYVIYAQDNANSLEKRLSVRPAHLARLQLLHDEGRLLTAGLMRTPTSQRASMRRFRSNRIRRSFEKDGLLGTAYGALSGSHTVNRKE